MLKVRTGSVTAVSITITQLALWGLTSDLSLISCCKNSNAKRLSTTLQELARLHKYVDWQVYDESAGKPGEYQ